MSKRPYTKGLHDLGGGIYAYLQPDGSWGLSNAGLISDGTESMLVDTLYDLELTGEMLDAMTAACPAAQSIDYLVNTHANGDHCYGNQLVKGAKIVASETCAREFETETPPQMMLQLLGNAANMGELGEFFTRCFGRFNYEGVTLTPPTKTFNKHLDIRVGRKDVDLIEVGPCHTGGDVMVLVPGDRVLFAGDILFIGGTPIMWDGPVGNWLRALDMILDMNVETIVPGHGPITDKDGVRAVRGYWEYITGETKKRFDLGVSAAEAAMDIPLKEYASWSDPERIAINTDALYREFSEDTKPADRVALFGIMAKMTLKKG